MPGGTVIFFGGPLEDDAGLETAAFGDGCGGFGTVTPGGMGGMFGSRAAAIDGGALLNTSLPPPLPTAVFVFQRGSPVAAATVDGTGAGAGNCVFGLS